MIITIIIIVIIFIVLKKQNQQIQPNNTKTTNNNLKLYKLNNNIFTQIERFFYKVLRDITDKMDLIIMTKVRLADIIHVCNNDYAYFNKIKSKHIDFVLIDNNGNIKLLIELDDKSHNNCKRQERDKFLNDIFNNLNINLLRIEAKYSYNIQELENKIKESL